MILPGLSVRRRSRAIRRAAWRPPDVAGADRPVQRRRLPPADAGRAPRLEQPLLRAARGGARHPRARARRSADNGPCCSRRTSARRTPAGSSKRNGLSLQSAVPCMRETVRDPPVAASRRAAPDRRRGCATARAGAPCSRTRRAGRFYANDIFWQPGIAPLAIALPETADETAAVVALAAAEGVAIVPRGGGMSYTKGYLPATARVDRDRHAAHEPRHRAQHGRPLRHGRGGLHLGEAE